jgi:hypothetical protein
MRSKRHLVRDSLCGLIQSSVLCNSVREVVCPARDRRTQSNFPRQAFIERYFLQVSLRRLIRTKLASVASMYEDRYDLWGLQQQAIVGTSDSLEGPQPASDKNGASGPLPSFLGFGLPRRKQAAPKAVEDWEVVVVGQRMPCRRIAELRKLEGWWVLNSVWFKTRFVSKLICSNHGSATGLTRLSCQNSEHGEVHSRLPSSPNALHTQFPLKPLL